jgi:hypothetical protein
MEDRGKIIKEVIDSYGIKDSHVWKRMGISKDTFIRLKKTTNVPDADVERIGHIIRHDFRKEIPGLKVAVIENDSPLSLVAEANETIPAKYFGILIERMAALMKEVAEMKQLIKELSNPKQQ